MITQEHVDSVRETSLSELRSVEAELERQLKTIRAAIARMERDSLFPADVDQFDLEIPLKLPRGSESSCLNYFGGLPKTWRNLLAVAFQMESSNGLGIAAFENWPLPQKVKFVGLLGELAPLVRRGQVQDSGLPEFQYEGELFYFLNRVQDFGAEGSVVRDCVLLWFAAMEGDPAEVNRILDFYLN